MRLSISILFLFICFLCCQTQKPGKSSLSYKDPNLSPEQRADLLLKLMTIEEKAAQMRIFHANKGIENHDGKLHLSDFVKQNLQYGIAGIKNPAEHDDPADAARLNNDLQRYIIEHNRLGIPALFITESYNGVDAKGCTAFPRPITQAASWDEDLIKSVWDCMGKEARLRGLHMTHSPEIDIVRDPRFGRMSEAFGEDTHLVTEMAVAAVSGIQGGVEALKSTHIGAVVKHFAAYGMVNGGRNFSPVEISPRTLIDEVFPPFEGAVKRANALGVMAAHNDINGEACHSSKYLLTDVLRNQWDFEGYVVSDANDIPRLSFFMNVADNVEDATLKALEAGMDVDLYSDSTYARLPILAAKHPEITKYIDRSARRMLVTKFKLGMFDNPYIDPDKASKYIGSEENMTLANKADEAAAILLKNENSILPLAKNTNKKIALIGPTLTSDVLPLFQAYLPQLNFEAHKGFDLTDNNISVPKLNLNAVNSIDTLVSVAKRNDLIVLFVGGDEYTAKEAFFAGAVGDRAEIHPVFPQELLFDKLRVLGKPIIIVLKHRRTLAINDFAKHADAIVDLWEPSKYYASSLAKILFGDVNPSGKLPVTVPRTIGQFPFHYSGKTINNKKGYLFMENGPLYYFGYGLSYTTFAYGDLKLSSDQLTLNNKLQVSIKVTNTGSRSGQEIVQMYLKDIKASVLRPDKELKGFQKISLSPGESKIVTFTIDPEMLYFTDINMKRNLEEGTHTVMIGGSSNNTINANFNLILKKSKL
jgi:beta-glucosidase